MWAEGSEECGPLSKINFDKGGSMGKVVNHKLLPEEVKEVTFILKNCEL